MKSQTRDQYLLLISNSLDSRLSEKEQLELNKILADNADARSLLESIKSVKIALRSAPRRNAPRNFTLSSQSAKSLRHKAIAFPIYRFTAAFSSVAAIILLSYSFLFNTPSAAPAKLTVQAPALMSAESASNSPSSLQVNGQPIIITWNSPGGFGGGGGDANTLSAKAMDDGITLESAAPPMAAPQAPPVPSQKVQPTDEAILREASPVISGSGPILGISNQPQETAKGKLNPARFAFPLHNGWLIAGLITAVVALITGIITIVMKREKYH